VVRNLPQSGINVKEFQVVILGGDNGDSSTLREVEAGDREQVRAEAHAAVKLAPNRDVREIAALALARAGDTAGAEKLAAELDKDFPLDTLVQRYWLPTIRAGVALERKEPNRAIELLQVANAVELGSITPNLTILLCPVYVRGEAYLMLHDSNRAAAEFQKFIDHRGLVRDFPWAGWPASDWPEHLYDIPVVIEAIVEVG
jgi:eukaryotic-like serine/threonine-protein kinase